MKKILALLFTALLSLQAAAPKYAKGYNEALEAAQKDAILRGNAVSLYRLQPSREALP